MTNFVIPESRVALSFVLLTPVHLACGCELLTFGLIKKECVLCAWCLACAGDKIRISLALASCLSEI